MAYLTSRTQATSVACNDLVHIVKTNVFVDGNPDGSSFKATVGQLLSGCCVNDFYVKNIHGCNTGNLFVQPLDEGNIYFGANTAEDGFTIDLTTANPNRVRVGINKNNPGFTIDAVSYDGRQKFFWYDNLSPIAGSAYANAEYMAMSGAGEIVSNFVVYGPGGPNETVQGAGGIGMGFIGFDFINNDTINGFGAPGDAFIAAAGCTENLNIINDRRSEACNSSSDNIRFYAHYGVEGGTNTPHLHIQGRANSTSQQGEICVYCTDPTERLDVNGNLRIRTVPSASYSLSLGIAATGELRYQNTSDIRLKKDISTIESALTKVLNLRGVNFTWIDNEEVGTQIGFIAQEVEQVVPELTFEVPNPNEDYKGVHYENVSALLVEAVKELNEKTKLKEYTPTSINDPYGEKGDQVFDDNFMYIKTGAGWKKFPLMDI